jgi:hypothetical protein
VCSAPIHRTVCRLKATPRDGERHDFARTPRHVTGMAAPAPATAPMQFVKASSTPPAPRTNGATPAGGSPAANMSTTSIESLLSVPDAGGHAGGPRHVRSSSVDTVLWSERPHHRRVDTSSSSVTFASVDDSMSRSRTSPPLSPVPSLSPGSPVRRRPTTLTDISNLVALADPRVLKMHTSALSSLALAVDAMVAYNSGPSRSHWENADAHYRRAVKTAAHVSLWAERYWPVDSSVTTDSSVTSGEAILPVWYSWASIGWTSEARTRKRTALIAEALRRTTLMVEKQTAMLESLRLEMGSIASISLESTRRHKQRRHPSYPAVSEGTSGQQRPSLRDGAKSV